MRIFLVLFIAVAYIQISHAVKAESLTDTKLRQSDLMSLIHGKIRVGIAYTVILHPSRDRLVVLNYLPTSKKLSASCDENNNLFIKMDTSNNGQIDQIKNVTVIVPDNLYSSQVKLTWNSLNDKTRVRIMEVNDKNLVIRSNKIVNNKTRDFETVHVEINFRENIRNFCKKWRRKKSLN